MNTVTCVIHTRNEEKKIIDCIHSARLLTEDILVVDMESTDDTLLLVKQSRVAIKSFPFSYYVEPARAFGIKNAKRDWVFILDADERISPELANEIKHVLKNANDEYGSYEISRKNIFGKKWLTHGGWWPDYQTRLIRKSAFKQWPSRIHSAPEIELKKGKLQHSILHYFHGDINGMVEKTSVYEQIEAELLFNAGRKVNTLIFFRKYLGELYRRLIKYRGFLDGTEGIIESIYQAYSKTITYIYLYEKQKGGTL